MRPASTLVASSLTALLLASASTRAEPAAGWVDPPAKTSAVRSGAANPRVVEPAPEATKAEDRSAEPTTRSNLAQSRPAAGPRHRRQAGRHEQRLDRRRMALSSEVDATAPGSRFGGWAGQAQRLTSEYLDSVSAPNDAMLASAPRFYGSQVRFYGRSMGLGSLMAEKRRFVRRWPVRRYEPQDGTMRTTCFPASATCVVRTVMGFSAENPARGARSQGLSELSLIVSFADERPVIVSESSHVLRRGNTALSSAERGRRDGA